MKTPFSVPWEEESKWIPRVGVHSQALNRAGGLVSQWDRHVLQGHTNPGSRPAHLLLRASECVKWR